MKSFKQSLFGVLFFFVLDPDSAITHVTHSVTTRCTQTALFFFKYIFTVLTPLGIKRSNPCEVERGTCGRSHFSRGMKVHEHAFCGWKRLPCWRSGVVQIIMCIMLWHYVIMEFLRTKNTMPDLLSTSLVRFCRCSTWIADARASGQSSLHSDSHKQTPMPLARRRQMCFL